MSSVSWSYVLSSCLLDIPVDRTRDSGPDGARNIIQMSGRSPGVLSRGRRQERDWVFHHWSVLERTVPAGVCLFLRAQVIDVRNRFWNACFTKGPGKMNTCIVMTSSSIMKRESIVCDRKSAVPGVRGPGFYFLIGGQTVLVCLGLMVCPGHRMLHFKTAIVLGKLECLVS